jgi:hypothetical protein
MGIRSYSFFLIKSRTDEESTIVHDHGWQVLILRINNQILGKLFFSKNKI